MSSVSAFQAPQVSAAPELAVVIPVHNEAENIGKLLQEVCTALRGRVVFEIVVVDDHSSDATPDVLRQSAAEIPELRPLRHRHNAGQSMAVLSGVKAARAGWIATLDGDGQNDPADLPALWNSIRAEVDGGTMLLLAGHRTQRKDSWVKRRSSRIANRVRAALLKDSTPDTGCGLKMLSRNLFLELPAFDHMHRFLPALVLRHGGRVRSVPVNHRPRQGGSSHYGTWGRLRAGLIDMLGVIWLQRRWRNAGGVRSLLEKDS